MTKITFLKNKVTIEGHSNSTVDDIDLVCAGISSIVCGSIDKWSKNPLFQINVDEKKAFVSVVFNGSNNDSGWIEFLFFISLLRSVYTHYPHCIEFIG